MNVALSFENVHKHYGKNHVVQGVSLQIPEGIIFGLLGPNGAGKSTLITMTTGVTSISSGVIKVFGTDNQIDPKTAKKNIGVMPQELVADNFFDVGTSLRLQPGYYGAEFDPEWHDRVVKVLDLQQHSKKMLLQLSGGMKRRFLMAKALMHKPKLLILDEPTAGVDVELRRSIWDFVRVLNHEFKMTILLTTHYLEEAEQMCSQLAFLQKGQIIAQGTPRSLLDRIQTRTIQVQTVGKAGGEPKIFQKETVQTEVQAELMAYCSSIPASDQIIDIKIQQPSLEDVFVQLMNAGGNDG